MKILVVGCGSIGRRHAANAAAMAETAVVDADRNAGEQTAAQTGALHFTSLEQGLAWGPAGVIVAVPHIAHLDVALAAAKAGADVLIEKPLSHSMDGVTGFLAALKEMGRRAWVVNNMRFHPALQILREHLPSIGKPLFARAHVGNLLSAMRPGADYRQLYCARRSAGGGVILDAIHEIDYLTWLFGPVVKVRCQAARLGGLDIDVEDYASLTLSFAQGPAAQVQMDYLRPFKRRGCEIVGSEGILLWESEGKSPEYCTVRRYSKGSNQWETLLFLPDVDTNAPYVELLKHFLMALDGKDEDLLTASMAAEELAVSLEALRQGMEGL